MAGRAVAGRTVEVGMDEQNGLVIIKTMFQGAGIMMQGYTYDEAGELAQTIMKVREALPKVQVAKIVPPRIVKE
jgi:hypothetical protein